MDPETMEQIPMDGESLGEIMIRGNSVMKGYLKNPEATEKAFAGGYFHSGDIAFQHPDGYLKIADRAKDIIISGGENISSVEVEGVLMRHPAVLLCAVVAKPDDKWGEVPCAFVELKDGAEVGEADLIAFSRERLAGFKTPKAVIFQELQDTEIRVAPDRQGDVRGSRRCSAPWCRALATHNRQEGRITPTPCPAPRPPADWGIGGAASLRETAR